LAPESRRLPPVAVNRKTPPPALQPFTDYFQGFEEVGAVRKVFGEKTEEVLSRLKIGFLSNRRMYMGIRDHDGNLAVGTYHLRHSTKKVLYLDIVHELFHIGQWRRDKEWFTREHEKFMRDFRLYYVSPLEVPAYRHTVLEAERLGMTTGQIEKYLEMMPVSEDTWKGFLKEMGLNGGASRGSSRAKPKNGERLPVKINRDPKLVLLPFTDYFQGFEEAPPVKALFGGRAGSALRRLRVEFVESPFGSIMPSDDDGHLVVNPGFMREAGLPAIYLDVVLGLNVLKRTAANPQSLWPGRRGFGDSPLVLESYRSMVAEAKRIGVPDSETLERLSLPRRMLPGEEFGKFAKTVGLKAG
jgi:hypothetical protein